MKLNLAKFCSASSPSLLFEFSVQRFLSSAVAHQLFDEIHGPIEFRSLNSLPHESIRYSPPNSSSVSEHKKTSVTGPAKFGNLPAHLQGLFGEKRLCAALTSCAKSLNWYLGVQIHGLIIRNRYEDNLFLNSALVDFYAKCGVIEDARRVFDGMKHHDQISWSSIISGYGRSGCFTEAISLFKKMLATQTKPNSVTYNSIINSCAVVKAKLEQVALVHAHVIILGYNTNRFVASSLIDYYSKCEGIGKAASVFNSTVNSDVVVYNSMISGYSQNLHHEEALKLFCRMRNIGLKPTDYTMSIVLSACGSQTIICIGKQVHCLVTKVGFLCSLFVSCALIDMYSKCGDIDKARAIFDQTVKKNTVLWTSMVLGYAQHGSALQGLELFDQSMMEGSFVPDHVCFTAILTACNHAGFLDKGVEYFNKMKDFGLAPDVDQYACLIDLFARKGHLVKAKQLIKEMPFHANNVMLSSFLSSCKSYGAIKQGIEVANQLISLRPNDASTYVTMARLYGEAGLWDKVAYFKKLMEEKGRRKRNGWSWVEVDRN